MSKRCRRCGSQVPENSITCPKCYREMPRVPPAAKKEASARDPRIGLLLAIFPGVIGLWGLGHIYMGLTERGLYLMLTGILLTSILVALAYGWFLIVTIICLVMFSIIWLAAFAIQALEIWMLANMGAIEWSSGMRFR